MCYCAEGSKRLLVPQRRRTPSSAMETLAFNGGKPGADIAEVSPAWLLRVAAVLGTSSSRDLMFRMHLSGISMGQSGESFRGMQM